MSVSVRKKKRHAHSVALFPRQAFKKETSLGLEAMLIIVI